MVAEVGAGLELDVGAAADEFGEGDAQVHPGQVVRAGHFADLVAFDPASVGATAAERVHDQPGGADRLIARSTGVEHMWVNGVLTRQAGEDVPGAAAGRVLRSGSAGHGGTTPLAPPANPAAPDSTRPT